MAINLVNDGQKSIRPLALAPVDFIDADGPDPFQYPVRQAPLHKPLDRAIDTFPTGAKGPRRLPPRQPPRPAGKKAHHGNGDRAFAIAPRDMLDHHAVLRALHPPGGVEKAGRDAPQRHKEPRPLRQPVIAGRRFQAVGTLGGDGRVRFHLDFEATGLAVAMALEADVAENESGKTLNRVQNGFNVQLNSWSPFRGLVRFRNLHLTRTSGDQLFAFTVLDALAPSLGGGGERRRRLSNSSSRRRRSPRVTDSPAPAQRRAPDVRKQLEPSR